MTDIDYDAPIRGRYAIPVHATLSARVAQRERGHDAYAYRLGMEQIAAEIDAIWPDTRAVAQPWFKDWQPRTGGGAFLAQFDKQLKSVYGDMSAMMNRQLYGESLLHGISEDASPFWKASIVKPPWWKRLLRR
jgi:hypothetical protein